MNFRDHFSRQSEMYLKGRPTYPDELFEYLASVAPSRGLCWDCATGNGQAAVSLSKYFKKVIATDASEKQIKHAILRDNIEYRVATAEQSGLSGQSVELVTVATAAHWFDHDKFYAEVKRVAKPGALLAIWTYSEAKITPEIDKLMEWFMYEYLLDYWPDVRWHVRKKYETLPFPFKPMQTPVFHCKLEWSREHWLNYIKSWSAYNVYWAKHNIDPLEALLPELELLWNNNEQREIVWQLHLKCTILSGDLH